MNTSLDELLEPYLRMKEGEFPKEKSDRLQAQFDKGQWYVLLFVNDHLIGSARLRRRDARNCEIHSVYVDPDYRDRGMGSMLIDTLLKIAQSEGFGEVHLDTMPFMESALALYKSKGFEQVSSMGTTGVPESVAKRIGTIFMKKKIPPVM